MLHKNLEKLEYNKILEQLSNYCLTSLGKELAMQLQPSTSHIEVERLLDETTEASKLITEQSSLPLAELPSFVSELAQLKSKISLSAQSIWKLANFLKTCRNLKEYYYTENRDFSIYSILEELFHKLYTNVSIEKTILNVLLEDGYLEDNASNMLQSLRKSKRAHEQSIREQLNYILHKYSKCIMEPIITIRNNRYVIPVKETEKENIRGFVHDISASGSTVFIEPMSVFELNNKIQSICFEESIEIEKILYSFSSLFFPITDLLKSNLEVIGRLDFIFAKASYSKNLHGIRPSLTTKKEINLVQAKHPLLDQKKAVPIDISLGKDYTSLIITGPNTGGKTVTLKTVGLLTLMACSGLYIPAKENSSIFVFEHVFADLGDEQSIQESLSTFSSHMLNIVQILNDMSENSLILLDELGSGTDPLEGSSLAISLLEYFHKQGTLTIATTHYPELKYYTIVTDGFENASCEFDVETLSPTYRLLVGVPGKSNAFAISKRLGLPEHILSRAENFQKQEDIKIEEILKEIYDNKLIIEKEKDELKKNSKQIQLLRVSLEKEKMEQSEKKNEIIENAKKQAREILLSAKQEANYIIKEMNNLSSNSLKDANILRNKLNNSLQNLQPNISTNVKGTSSLSCKDISIGMNVFIPSLNQTGCVIELPNRSQDVTLLIGNIKIIKNISELQKASDSSIKKDLYTNNRKKTSLLKSKSVSTELNVLGYTVEEAIHVIDKFLDDASIACLSTVRIVHGKGTR